MTIAATQASAYASTASPARIAERIRAYEEAGLDFMLLQSNPMEEGFDRFLSDVLPLVNRGKA
jgi:FMNH2-dependent dimethyl sulfone monooxygenase